MSRIALLLAAVLALPSLATERSSVHVREFKRANPCPSTGLRRGRCPGFVVDHVQPLCAGGPDHPANMQWQSVEDAKVKDRDERRLCRAIRRSSL